ncbi:MAG: proline dehydrogenase family protein, partial [Planctomycetes bacterium]|nr:proline dehydrogenase family protein [Planctomycetota bacterium]
MSSDFNERQLAQIEQTTQEIGRQLFDHLGDSRATVLERRWWDDRIMAWAMADESVKVQMFRFIDVLPMLQTSDAVIEHLHEYFNEVRETLPSAVRVGMKVVKPRSIAGRALAIAARRNASSHARRFIAGSNIKEVIAAARRQRKLGRAFTLDILGEAVISDVEAERFLQSYVDLIEGIAPTVNAWPDMPQIDRGVTGELPRVNISVKLSALDSQFDAIDHRGSTERASARLRELLRVARRHRAFINVDMESYKVKDLTLHVFKGVLMEDEFRECGDVGIVIQAYLTDAQKDLVELRDWAARRGHPVWVRLVKGAYWDYETVHAKATGWPIPVFQQKPQSDVSFERLTRFLMQNYQHLRTALGSHNIRSLAHGIAVAEHLDIPQHGYELQMLYGMGDAEKQVLVDRGHRLRIYMPYGELIPGMAYLVRRLLENTSNDSFLRASFAEQVAPEILLMNPIDELARSEQAETPTEAAKRFQNEPPIDFSKETNRQAMSAALAEVKSQLGVHYPLVIGGQAVDTQQHDTSHNPADKRQVIGTAASATAEHAAAALDAARAAGPAWAALDVEARAEYLRRAAEVMRRRRFELAAWAIYECAKPWREADADVSEAIDFCMYYALEMRELGVPRQSDMPGEENTYYYRPRGVVVVIAPWTFPLAILTGMTAAALVTGNSVVMKPAEQSPVIAAKLMEICRDVGIPDGVVNYLPGIGEVVGPELVGSPDVDLI